PPAAAAAAASCPASVAQRILQPADPGSHLFQRLVARQVDLDRGDGDMPGAHGMEVGTGAGVGFGTGAADPPEIAAARVLGRNAGLGAVAIAQARDLEALDLRPRQ